MSDDAGRIAALEAHRSRIEKGIRARYADELSRADICDSLRVEKRIRAEIEQALTRTDSPVA
jgi:hypothetical protein